MKMNEEVMERLEGWRSKMFFLFKKLFVFIFFILFFSFLLGVHYKSEG